MNIIHKLFSIDFLRYEALTLPQSSVTKDNKSGWTITGIQRNPWLTWINNFNATHPVYGRVWG